MLYLSILKDIVFHFDNRDTVFCHILWSIAIVFILCESRCSNMYRAIWNKIIKLMAMLQQNVKFIMSKYEMAAMKVINEQFSAAEAYGCWFHYNIRFYYNHNFI